MVPYSHPKPAPLQLGQCSQPTDDGGSSSGVAMAMQMMQSFQQGMQSMTSVMVELSHTLKTTRADSADVNVGGGTTNVGGATVATAAPEPGATDLQQLADGSIDDGDDGVVPLGGLKPPALTAQQGKSGAADAVRRMEELHKAAIAARKAKKVSNKNW